MKQVEGRIRLLEKTSPYHSMTVRTHGLPGMLSPVPRRIIPRDVRAEDAPALWAYIQEHGIEKLREGIGALVKEK